MKMSQCATPTCEHYDIELDAEPFMSDDHWCKQALGCEQLSMIHNNDVFYK